MDKRCYETHWKEPKPAYRLHRSASLVLLIASLLPLLTSTAVFASTVTGAVYSGVIQISNNNTTAAYNLCVNMTLSTQQLVNNSYINSNCNNTAIQSSTGTDAVYMPAQGATNAWIIFVPSIAANSLPHYTLYTGGPAMNSTIRYFPGTTGMVTTDSASLEPANNFTIELKGYFNTGNGGGKALVVKPGAFSFSQNATGRINATFDFFAWARPTAHTDEASQWTNPANVYDNDNTTSGYNWQTGNLTLAHTSFFSSSQLKLNCSANVADRPVKIYVYTGGAWTCIYTGNIANTTAQWYTFPYGATYSINSTRIQKTDTTGTLYIYDWHVEQASSPTVSSALASGEHTVTVAANTTYMRLAVDSVNVSVVSIAGVSITNNASNWTAINQSAMLYLEYLKVWVNGTLKQHITWQNGATFTDQSGNGNNAAPSFRTTGTDSKVNATLMSFGPVSSAVLSGYSSAGNIAQIITTAPAAPAELVSEGATVNLPGASLVNNALDTAGIPRSLFWIPAAMGQSILAGFILYGFTRDLLIQSAVSAFVMFLFVLSGPGVIPWFLPILFIVEAVVVLVTRKKQGM